MKRKRVTISLFGISLIALSLIGAGAYSLWPYGKQQKIEKIFQTELIEDPYVYLSGTELGPAQEKYVLEGSAEHPATEKEINKYFRRTKDGHLIKK